MDFIDAHVTDSILNLGLAVMFFAALALDRRLTVKYLKQQGRKHGL